MQIKLSGGKSLEKTLKKHLFSLKELTNVERAMGGKLVLELRAAVRAQVLQAPANAWGGIQTLRLTKARLFASFVGLRTLAAGVQVRDVGKKRMRRKKSDNGSKPTLAQIEALQRSDSSFSSLTTGQIKRRFTRQQAKAIQFRLHESGKTRRFKYSKKDPNPNNKLLPMVWRTDYLQILEKAELEKVAAAVIQKIIKGKS